MHTIYISTTWSDFWWRVKALAIINLRVSEEMKRKLAGFARAKGTTQTEMVKAAIAEKLIVHEVAQSENVTEIPGWVPEGKYVALVRGAVAAVGDSVADVSSTAIAKFPNESIRVARVGKPIRPVQYAFPAEAGLPQGSTSWRIRLR